jgi:hypothetical protein
MNFTVIKGTFQITFRDNDCPKWRDQTNMNPGFNCSINLNSRWKGFRGIIRRQTIISSDDLGITPDYDYTPTLYQTPPPHAMDHGTNGSREHFLRLNKTLVDPGRRAWNTKLKEYRTYFRTQALRKHQALSYSFYINVYCNSRLKYHDIPRILATNEVNPTILGITETARSALIYLFERMVVVNQSKVHQWW